MLVADHVDNAARTAAGGVVAYAVGRQLDEIVRRCNAHDKLVCVLTRGEDIISGLEAECDNAGIDMREARALVDIISHIALAKKGA